MNYRFDIHCSQCGRFCIPYDEETPFGCANPENPEPYDSDFYCKKCSIRLKEKWLSKFRNGNRHGYWQKSRAEIEAAKECKLVWIHNRTYCFNGKETSYCYITQNEFDSGKYKYE